MKTRPIDANQLYRIEKLLDTDIVRQDKVALNLLEQVLYDIRHVPTLTPPPITGDTSDGYHTFNELYHHRAVLFSVVCNERPDIAWKSKRHHDGTMYNGMFIVGINTPEGQATYHYDIDPYWELFHVKELEYAPEWDGHTPEEAIRRIGTLTPQNEWVSVETPPTEQGWYHVAILDLKTGKYNVEQDLYSIELAKTYGFEPGFCKANRWEERERIDYWCRFPSPPDSRPPEGEEDT